MSVDRKRWTAIKISKERTKKVGVRSISDIINNKTNLTFKEKVDYIRHHYTYYNGNYEFFHTSKGKPNSKKYKLNNLIVQILKGKKDPSELKTFNTLILDWRKLKESEKLKEKNNFLTNFKLLEEIKPYTEELPHWKQEISNNLHDNPYIVIIEEFLVSEANNLTNEELDNIPYKKLKNLAVAWKADKLTNASEEYKIRTAQSIQAKLLKEKRKEDRRIYNLMKQYAMDLGYIKEEDKNAETI